MNTLTTQALQEAEKASQDFELASFRFLLAARVLEEKLAAVNAAFVIEQAKERG